MTVHHAPTDVRELKSGKYLIPIVSSWKSVKRVFEKRTDGVMCSDMAQRVFKSSLTLGCNDWYNVTDANTNTSAFNFNL
jgi:hypothetical protein